MKWQIKMISSVNNKEEINKFNNLASAWWDINGSFKTLHQINPIRVEFINSITDITGATILDIGCGGGILSEGLAAKGAVVTAIDLAPDSIEMAKLHLYESGLTIDYQCVDVAELVKNGAQFDHVVCMEMLEHVDDIEFIIQSINAVVKKDGLVFLSTLNRNLISYLGSIVVAEYMLNLLPRGTHDYQKYIKPHELVRVLRRNNLELQVIKGISYNPLTGKARLSDNVEINYMLAAKKI